jgi:hypothetical protein
MDIVAAFLTSLGEFLTANLATVVSTFFGTFLGAYLAFEFQRRHEARRELAANFSAGKRTQFAIITQLKTLKNVKKQYLDPKRTDPDRAFTLTPFTVHATFPRLDLDDLAFTLEGEGAQLLNDLMLTEQRFFTFLGGLEQRNVRHEEMQRQMAKTGTMDGSIRQILKDMTESLYGLADDAEKSHDEGLTKLKKYLEIRFPKSKALGVEYKY